MQVTPVNDFKQASPDPGVPLEQLAHHLAENHTLIEKGDLKPRALLLKHLPIWEQALLDAYQYFRATSAKDLSFSRAGEWMLDNFYVVEQTFHQIEEDLPKKYFNQLPKLEKTAFKGYPRIFALAWELVEYSHGQLDLSQITTFLQEYQQTTSLMIGELWAFPTMLRIGVLEHLATAVSNITGKDPPEVLKVQPILPASGVQAGETIVSNCFISLRLLSITDWKSFFEETSRVEQILINDPAGVFASMDFETRNQYRSVIEDLARHSNFSEESVAQFAVECAIQGHNEPNGLSPGS